MRGHRPADLSAAEIGFTRRRPVPWLNPGLLAGAAVRVQLAQLFGDYLDKRELQAALPATIHDHSTPRPGSGEFWLDYTADVGDGFDATYSVAYRIAQPVLAVPGAGELPRPDVLVLGGDQVYPTASTANYADRWKGPYRAALPELGPQSPTLYALPGNHDWYDGLTAFLRLFAQGDPVGGWQTRQTRSYFALRLPHGWWWYAVDVQLSSYLDKPQLQYFAEAARHLTPDSRVVLAFPKPAWLMTGDRPEAYDSVDYFIRTIIEPTGARIPLMVSGDLHHYARYAGDGPDGRGRQLITCGGGGAYLVGTAHLPRQVVEPPPDTAVRQASAPQTYRHLAAYPDRARSRRLGWRIFGRLPTRNPGFVAMVGTIQTLLMLALLHSDGRLTLPVAAAGALVVAGTMVLATVLGACRRRHWIAGAVHAVPHLALGAAGAWVWARLPFVDAPPPADTLLAFVVYLPVVGLVDTWLVGVYLLLARYAKVNVNELYAGLGIEDDKSFLRMRFGADGSLTIFPIALPRVCHRWRADPDGGADQPWIVPQTAADAPPVALIEPPLVLR